MYDSKEVCNKCLEGVEGFLESFTQRRAQLKSSRSICPPEVKQGGHMPPSNSAPPEFQIVCFCPP